MAGMADNHRMSRKSFAVAGILALAIFACPGSAATKYSKRAKVQKPPELVKLEKAVAAQWSDYKTQHGIPAGGLAVYVATPEGNYFASSGMAPGNGPDTHFRVASITKTFTAAAIMLLNQQGKLRIDDTIVSPMPGQSAPYVPDSAEFNIPYKSRITIRQLLAHTAGVFDVTNEAIPATCPVPYANKNYPLYVIQELHVPNHQFTPEELVGVVAKCQLSYFAPASGHHYSNTGYSLLAIIIQQVSGMSYDQFILQNLIAPNGLSTTSVPMLATDQSLPSPYASGYVYEGGAVTDVTRSNMSMNIAEGNIVSTPADLARWIRRLLRGEAGPNAASVADMMTPTPQSGNRYGLGLISAPGLGYGHNGAHEGYMAYMLYDPSVDVAVIVYISVWDVKNLMTDEAALLLQMVSEARAAAGY